MTSNKKSPKRNINVKRVKKGDRVWHVDPVKYAQDGNQTLYEWTIVSILKTNTDDGDIAALSKPDETKRGGIGENRCNVPVYALSLVGS